MTLHISTLATKKVSSALVISGSGRSGTTIIGKLLHSMQGVEYAFEPPLLVTLLPLIQELDEISWKLLYETYLYEDFFISSLSGRAINTNRADDSSIYQVKSDDEINSRLNYSIRKQEAEKSAESATIIYKLPNVVPFLPKLADYYPDTRFLIMKRDAVGTINSLIQKSWFSDVNVCTSMVWPYRSYGDVKIPSWVRKNDDALWLDMSEIDRCAYYYILVNEDVSKISNRIELSYQALLLDPQATAHSLAQSFGLNFGTKTQSIIDSIEPAKKERDIDILQKISPTLAAKVAYYSNES
ncbi:MAG: sulfotransferase [Methylophilaceae bacterium]